MKPSQNYVATIKFTCPRSSRTRAAPKTRHYILCICDVGHDVSCKYDIGLAMLRHDTSSHFQSEKVWKRGNARCRCHCSYIFCGINSQYSVTPLLEGL